jgi:hypothetical protein
MALRDEEPLRARTRTRLPWKDALGHLPAILLAAGLFMYAYLSICYDRFYGRLGVDPNDVGLSYAGTLARSSGFVVVYLVAAVFVSAMVVAIRPSRQVVTIGFRHWRVPVHPRWNVAVAVLVVGLMVVSLLGWPLYVAGDAARHVQSGYPVGTVLLPGPPDTPFPFPPLPVLAIRADPASIEPADKPADSPSVQRLRGRTLLYLGQSDGTVVLYDARTNRAVYVPGSTIILHVANCDAEPPPEVICSQARGY